MIVAERDASGRINCATDALGSVTGALVSSQLVNTYTYKPYGSLLASTGSGAAPELQWLGTFGARPTGRSDSDYCVGGALHYATALGSWTTAVFSFSDGSTAPLVNPTEDGVDSIRDTIRNGFHTWASSATGVCSYNDAEGKTLAALMDCLAGGESSWQQTSHNLFTISDAQYKAYKRDCCRTPVCGWVPQMRRRQKPRWVWKLKKHVPRKCHDAGAEDVQSNIRAMWRLLAYKCNNNLGSSIYQLLAGFMGPLRGTREATTDKPAHYQFQQNEQTMDCLVEYGLLVDTGDQWADWMCARYASDLNPNPERYLFTDTPPPGMVGLTQLNCKQCDICPPS